MSNGMLYIGEYLNYIMYYYNPLEKKWGNSLCNYLNYIMYYYNTVPASC